MAQTKVSFRHLFQKLLSLDLLIVLSLFAAAALLRVWGVRWSLPYVIHADESLIVDAGVHIVKTGDLNPHFFQYPSLVIYIQAAIYKLNLLWGTWRGYYTGPESLPDRNHIFALAPSLYLWGRTVTALIGAATVAGMYGVGRMIFGRPAALVAALLLLTSTIHVEQSHYLVTDAVMTALAVGVIAASWRLATRPSIPAVLLAGALAGLCAGAKYNGAYIILVPAIAWLLAWRTNRTAGFKNLLRLPAGIIGLVLAMVAGFLISNPYVILDWKGWSADFLFLIKDTGPTESPAAFNEMFGVQIGTLLSAETAIFLTSVLGTLWLIWTSVRNDNRQARYAAWLLAPFPLIYTLLMSRFTTSYPRYALLALPFLCLLGGYGVARAMDILAQRLPASIPGKLRGATLLAGLVGLAIVVEPARRMVNFDQYLAMPDTRNLAFAWLRSELAAGKRAAMELQPWLACAPPPWACVAPDIYAPLDQLTKRPPSWYADRGYDYVLLVGKESAVLEQVNVSGPRNPDGLKAFLALPEARYFPGDGEGGKGPPVLVRRTAPDALAAMKNVISSKARFGDLAELWSYSLAPLGKITDYYDPAIGPPPSRLGYAPGQAVGLNLYFRALKDGKGDTRNWTVAVHLSDEAGTRVSQVDVTPISSRRTRPVSEWYKNEFLAGTYNLPLPPTLAPGAYRLSVKLYEAPAGASLPVTAVTGESLPAADLGTITIDP